MWEQGHDRSRWPVYPNRFEGSIGLPKSFCSRRNSCRKRSFPAFLPARNAGIVDPVRTAIVAQPDPQNNCEDSDWNGLHASSSAGRFWTEYRSANHFKTVCQGQIAPAE